MAQLRQLIKEYAESSSLNSFWSKNSDAIIKAKPSVPVVPTNRWEVKEKSLSKTFHFEKIEQKIFFVKELFEYELRTRHFASILSKKNTVRIIVRTEDVDLVTELDREYAQYADNIFKDAIGLNDFEFITSERVYF